LWFGSRDRRLARLRGEEVRGFVCAVAATLQQRQ
jgi:hypothetical protein